jgi:hypothetical protein
VSAMSGGSRRGGKGKEKKGGLTDEMKGEKWGQLYSRYPTSSNVPSELEFQSDIFGQ